MALALVGRVVSAWMGQAEANWAAGGRWVERRAVVGLVALMVWSHGWRRAVGEAVVLAECRSGAAVEPVEVVVSVQHVTMGRILVERPRGVGYAVLRAPTCVIVWERGVVAEPACHVGIPALSTQAEARQSPVYVADGFEGCV